MHNNQQHDLEVIKWAFEKAYFLGFADARDGIHINFDEVQKYFLTELEEFYSQQTQLDKEKTRLKLTVL